MASFFGEITPFSSRAVDDEDSENQPKYKVVFEQSKKETYCNIKLIIFSVGEIASIFVKSYFLPDNANNICSIKYSCEKDDEESTLYTGMRSNKNVKDVIAVSLFASSPDVIICDVSKSIPDEICHEITEIIFDNFLPSDVLILTSNHVAGYKRETPVSFEVPFLKCLSTSQHTAANSCNIPCLDPPNFLSNMPALLMLKCEIAKLSALCIVNYVETDAIDSLNVQVFNKVLKEAVVSEIPVNIDAKSRMIKYVKAKQSVESNLFV